MVQRTYIPKVDVERCNTCAVCTRGCPAETIPEQRKEMLSLRGRIYEDTKTAPSIERVADLEVPPCQEACPIHQDIQGPMKLIANKKYIEALKLIRETNALPSVTGYICTHPCEGGCNRNLIDEAVSIRSVRRFVADFDGGKLKPPLIKKNGRKVSIVGSGPSGLAAAYELAKYGYTVEIIEALAEPGGMLRWAIPSFRLPNNILERDIKYIERMGVTIRTGCKFGVDVKLSDFKKSGVQAIIVAIGTQEDLKMEMENDRRCNGYFGCLDFLGRYARGEQIKLGAKLIVVGGGNAAIDTARSALRCGTTEVTVVYRRSREEMPADGDEVREAEAEGVKIEYLIAPVKTICKDGVIQGVECIKTELAETDKSGRRRPVPLRGSGFVLDASSVISAIGQQPDLSWNREALPFDFSLGNTFIVNDDCLTNIENVFAAGDAVSGPSTVVEAMASGKKVAGVVDSYLSGKEQGES